MTSIPEEDLSTLTKCVVLTLVHVHAWTSTGDSDLGEKASVIADWVGESEK